MRFRDVQQAIPQLGHDLGNIGDAPAEQRAKRIVFDAA